MNKIATPIHITVEKHTVYLSARDTAVVFANSQNIPLEVAWKQLTDLSIHAGIYDLRATDYLTQELCVQLVEALPKEQQDAIKTLLRALFELETTIEENFIVYIVNAEGGRLVTIPSEEGLKTTITDTAKRLHMSKCRVLCRLLKCGLVYYHDVTNTLNISKIARQKGFLVDEYGFLLVTNKGRAYLRKIVD